MFKYVFVYFVYSLKVFKDSLKDFPGGSDSKASACTEQLHFHFGYLMKSPCEGSH